MKEYLLQQIADLVGTTYISDLHNESYRLKICHSLDSLNPDHYSVKEWSDAVNYILNGTDAVFDTSHSACQFLKQQLQKKS